MQRFLSITKPGIIVGNVITLAGAFFLASHLVSSISISSLLLLFVLTLLGMSFVIASGCVFNNVIDRDIDGLMERTRSRVLVKGLVSVPAALSYAVLLGLSGLVILYFATNPLTAGVALFGLVVYVCVYSLYAKRHSVYGTIIGGVAGAIPPVVGYCALTNRLDLGAMVLFSILFFWQIPHSYAIAIYRLADYEHANIPVLPTQRGIDYTKMSMLVYIAAFTIVAVMPTILGLTGLLYLVVALSVGLIWFYLGLQGFHRQQDDRLWARKLFFFSIINIMLLSLFMAL